MVVDLIYKGSRVTTLYLPAMKIFTLSDKMNLTSILTKSSFYEYENLFTDRCYCLFVGAYHKFHHDEIVMQIEEHPYTVGYPPHSSTREWHPVLLR